jgi:Regulator of ribonuclease activity B
MGRFGRFFRRRRWGGGGRRGGQGQASDQHFPIEPEDQEAVQRLQTEGKDLTKPVALVHTFVFVSQAAADDAAERLKKRGFEVTASPAQAGTGPGLSARMDSTIDAQSIADVRGRLTRFAGHHGGEYRGWQPA